MVALPETQLHHEELTQDPSPEAMIAIHGLLGSLEYLRAVAQQLNGSYRVFAPDLQGFGDSPKPHGLYTPDDHATALGAMAESLEAEPPFTVMAHSLGAVVGLRFAARNPELVKRLVLMGMPIHSTEEEGYRLLHDATKINWFMATQPGGRLVHDVLFEHTNIAKRYATRRFGPEIGGDVDKHTYESFSMSLVGLIERPGGVVSDLEVVLGAGIQVLAMYGDKDRWVNQAGRDQLQVLQSQGLSVVELLGDHHLPVTEPERVADIILAPT